MRFRFHLGTLVIVVLILGISFAALRESNEVWDSGVVTLTLGVLLVSILLAVHRTERRRAFWLGFALFGGVYLAVSQVPSIESRLITTKALAFLESKLSERPIVISGRVWDTWSRNLRQNNQTSIAFSPRGNRVASGSQGIIRVWDVSGGNPLGTGSGTTENFVRIGHSLLALIFAFVGGRLSCYLHSRNPGSRSRLPNPETGHEPAEHLS
jgi:hypothetical protein